MSSPSLNMSSLAPWRLVAFVLGIVGLIHVWWAVGESWPFSSRGQLADTVVGRQPFPPAIASWLVALALSGLATLVWASMTERLGPKLDRAACWLINLAIGVLVLRGSIGLISSVLGLGTTTGIYRLLDVLVYSPLCLWIAHGLFYRH